MTALVVLSILYCIAAGAYLGVQPDAREVDEVTDAYEEWRD
jgi:hypothetical protein